MVQRAELVHLTDARHAGQRVDDVYGGVVAQEQPVVAALGRIQAHDLEHGRGRFFFTDSPWRLDLPGQPGSAS